ncbi:hypothetical protein AB0C76_30965 [Kitasatospora sp. NPDC048722]|uniref:hypothetical protein n=1 Tax=Kitasatospora sp. NPDC048722 TaxID=3155639 RepID=UPI0033ECD423
MLSAATAAALLPAAVHAAEPEPLATHAGAMTGRECSRIDAHWAPARMKPAGAMVPEVAPVPEGDPRGPDIRR